MSSVRCRVEPDRSLVYDFIRNNGYPIEVTWDDLSDSLYVSLHKDGEVIGYAWGYFPDAGVFAPHVCVAEAHRGSMTRPLWQELERIAFWLGADQLVVGFEDDDPSVSRMVALLRRLGFRSEPGLFNLNQIFIKDISLE